MTLQGTKALVVGMKLSGMASVELLAREGAAIRATDLKPLKALPGAGELLERLRVDARQRDDVAETVDGQQPEREQDTLAQVGDGEDVLETFNHV